MASSPGLAGQSFNPRQARLAVERERLMRLNEESERVRVEPLDVVSGSEPEHYKVTFLCRGIIGIDPQTKDPVYGLKHEVEIYCDDDFPSEVPKLHWRTPIWHPNIQHEEPKAVCVNKAEWLAGTGLDDLCRQMFEMAQYKNYHAEFTYPFPLDQAAALWVRDFAEPRGIVNKRLGKFVDDKPFVKPTATYFLKYKTAADGAANTATPERPAPIGRLKLKLSPNSATSNPPAGEPRRVRIKT